MDKPKKDKPMNGLIFSVMTLVFKIRDALNPPKGKLMETGIVAGDHVLDYGCGPGSYTIAAARLVGESGKVHALDIHARAIESVERKAQAAGLTNIVTTRTDSPAGLDTESFDVVILYDIFHMLSDQAGVLKELHRVMKPDAAFSFSDHHMKEEDIMKDVTGSGLFELAKKGERIHTFRKVGLSA
jgi:ubiquinone/menaquinone biosynthesis C-methylase UbiE